MSPKRISNVSHLKHKQESESKIWEENFGSKLILYHNNILNNSSYLGGEWEICNCTPLELCSHNEYHRAAASLKLKHTCSGWVKVEAGSPSPFQGLLLLCHHLGALPGAGDHTITACCWHCAECDTQRVTSSNVALKRSLKTSPDTIKYAICYLGLIGRETLLLYLAFELFWHAKNEVARGAQ